MRECDIISLFITLISNRPTLEYTSNLKPSLIKSLGGGGGGGEEWEREIK